MSRPAYRGRSGEAIQQVCSLPGFAGLDIFHFEIDIKHLHPQVAQFRSASVRYRV